MFDIFIIKIEHMKQYKYHYFYKIENLIDGKYYYGIHSTDNINDGYMGSGSRLREAMKIFGKENFKKNIIKYFVSRKKASEYEALMVTEELVYNKQCYNIKCGGDYGLTTGTILVKDVNNNFLRVALDDERYKRGELVNFMTDCVSVFDKEDKCYKIVECEEFKTNREKYTVQSEGKIMVKNKDNENIQVSVDDERYKRGELVPIWYGRQHKKETIEKMHKTFQKIHHQQGQKNSQYGTCWITKEGINKKILKKDLTEYLEQGWCKGRFINEEQINRPTDLLDKNKVIALYDKYKNWTKVSKILGINRSTMLRYRKRNNL